MILSVLKPFSISDISVSVLQKNIKYTIKCHKSILAAASPFISSIILESSELGEDSILFTDMSNDELELLISFLYTGFVTFSSEIETQRFKSLLDQLGIEVPEKPVEDPGSTPEDHLITTVDQSSILYELQTVEQSEVSRILAEIISDFDEKQQKGEE